MIYNVSEYGSKFCVDKNTLLRMLERAFEEGYFGDKESKIARIKAIMDQLPSAKVPKVIS
jgi:hypothetical protein